MIRVVPLCLVLAVTACSKTTPASASQSAQAVRAQQPGQAAPADQSAQGAAVNQPAQSAAVKPDEVVPKPFPPRLPDVIARVNGDTIAKADLERAVRTLEGRARRGVPLDQRDRVYRGVLDQLIAYRLLVHESTARQIEVSDADVEARVTAIRKQYPSEDAFTKTLAQQNMTMEQFRADAKTDLRVTKMLASEVNTKVAVQPQEVTTFYQQNPEKFKQGERVRASHILIRAPEKADAATKETARAKASELLKEVKGGGDFGALAKQHSQDPGSAQNGGDLGYFVQGQMVGAFDKAAFSMKPGDVSDLVETPFGFHIIKVADRQAPRTVPLDEVKPQIEQFLQNQQLQQKTQAFIETLKAKGKVEILI